MKTIKSIVLVLGMALSPVYAFAGDDSSAMDEQGMTGLVSQSTAVMMKVPVSQDGKELQAATEMRVVQSTVAPKEHEMQAVWNTGVDVSKAPQTKAGSDNGDSSTWGWRAYRPGGWGWGNPYYNWYRPTYGWGGGYWNYGNPYYYNAYYPTYVNTYPVWGYRYYYWRRW